MLVSLTGGNSRMGSVDVELVALLEEALEALGPDPSSERARLLASLAVEIQHGADDARRMALGREAMAIARATQDPVALGYVLTRSWTMLDGSRPWHIEFGRVNAEAEAMAGEIGDTNTLRDTRIFQQAIASMVGDRAEAELQLTAYRRIADQSRRRDLRVSPRNHRASRRFAGVSRKTKTGLESGRFRSILK